MAGLEITFFLWISSAVLCLMFLVVGIVRWRNPNDGRPAKRLFQISAICAAITVSATVYLTIAFAVIAQF